MCTAVHWRTTAVITMDMRDRVCIQPMSALGREDVLRPYNTSAALGCRNIATLRTMKRPPPCLHSVSSPVPSPPVAQTSFMDDLRTATGVRRDVTSCLVLSCHNAVDSPLRKRSPVRPPVLAKTRLWQLGIQRQCVSLDQRNYSMSSPVSAEMGDRLGA